MCWAYTPPLRPTRAHSGPYYPLSLPTLLPGVCGGCEVTYCNIEGIHWVSGDKLGAETPQTLVAVSDKMKSKGRQPAVCHEKDQAVHLFAMP